MVLEEPTPQQQQQPMDAASKIKLMAEQLETPANSLSFLELYHKSSLKVEEAATKLKHVSIVFLATAGFLFAVEGLHLIGESMKAALPASPKLQSSKYVDLNSYEDT